MGYRCGLIRKPAGTVRGSANLNWLDPWVPVTMPEDVFLVSASSFSYSLLKLLIPSEGDRAQFTFFVNTVLGSRRGKV
jgi:hypothetical protein